MKFVAEYREPELVNKLKKEIFQTTKNSWSIMEICGGQTHTIMKYNIEEFLPEKIRLIHGPGCPVCVTPLEKIDKAIKLSLTENVILTSYGDMLRVPGSESDMLNAKAEGADIRMVYSPLDAVKIAEENPSKYVVFFAVGFETTAPANAFSLIQAERKGIKNFLLLTSHFLVPPAIELLLSDPSLLINGFLAAGHVCTIMGYQEYESLVRKYNIPIVITGFEPVDILQGIQLTIRQLESGRSELENQYSRAVTRNGNFAAKKILREVYEITDMTWRGIGKIKESGLRIKDKYESYDAEKVFDISYIETKESENCIAGEILQGKKVPSDCLEFGKNCNPEHPVGAPMVSSEGACAAYYRYGK